MSPARVELAFQCVVAGWVSVIIEAGRIAESPRRTAYLAERRARTLALLDGLRAEAEAAANDADHLRSIQQARAAICSSVSAA